MPELPEVETIRKGLQKYLVGHTITAIDIHLPKQVRGEKQLVIGAKVIAARRFGKGLVIDFDNGNSLAIHVKMTGQLLYQTQGWRAERVSRRAPAAKPRTSDGRGARQDPEAFNNLPDKYTHVVFHLDRGAVLYYRDIRQFGWIHILPTTEVAQMPFFKGLGPEPLKDLTLDQFTKLVQTAKTPIKILIMDQTKIAGIGNIYANDALYIAKIHPKRPAASLAPKEIKHLFTAIEEVLQKGIDVGGASERDYVDVLGGRGQYQNFFAVYQKAGEKCKRCGSVIARTVLGGRGTFFCPKCQK